MKYCEQCGKDLPGDSANELGHYTLCDECLKLYNENPEIFLG